MTNEELTRILATPPMKSDAQGCRLYRAAEFTAWERGLKGQMETADPGERAALERMLTRLLGTKARVLR
jgi:hypothetical protein